MTRVTVRSAVRFFTIAGIVFCSSVASAGTAFMASSGHPWVGGNGDISGSLANFSVGDAQVCARNSGSWVIPIAVPTSTGTVTRTVSADFTAGATLEAWSFRSDGSVFSGRTFSGTSRTISVPAGGTLFVKAILSSALAPACISTAVLVS